MCYILSNELILAKIDLVFQMDRPASHSFKTFEDEFWFGSIFLVAKLDAYVKMVHT